MPANYCDYCLSGKCDIDDKKCTYNNLNYEDDCDKYREKMRLKKRREERRKDDDDDDGSSLLGIGLGLASIALGGRSGGIGGFGGGGFGGGGSGGKF